MEKFYLGKLMEQEDQTSDQLARSKIVELNYERKPPSFGIIYNEFEVSDKSLHHIRDINRTKRYPNQIVLKALELEDGNEAKFKSIQTVELKGMKLIDFDTSRTVFMDKLATKQCSKDRRIHCILLDESGGLHSLDFVNGTLKCLTSDVNDLTGVKHSGKYFQCKLINLTNEEPISMSQKSSIVYLLAEKCCLSLTVQQSESKGYDIIFLSSYVCKQDSAARGSFTRMFTIESKPKIVIVESNDLTLRILNGSNCLSIIDFAQIELVELNHFDGNRIQLNHLTISANSDGEEFLLISHLGNTIIAHTILIKEQSNLEDGEDTNDPDRILPREPSFECEKSWTFELGQDNRKLVPLNDSMCLIWSLKHSINSSQSIDLPKYLLVSYRFNLILLSFEQEPAQPFSVIYDRAFLKVTPMTVNGDNEQDFIDIKTKPKLIERFKLIGTNQSDALFNTIFLAKNNTAQPPRIIMSSQLSQMGLIVNLMSTGDVLLLKLIDSSTKDSLYQRIASDSIRASSDLLKAEISRLECENKRTKDLLSKLESQSGETITELIDTMQVELVHGGHQAHKTETSNYLYNLMIELFCPEATREIVVISSTIEAQMKEPTSNGLFELYQQGGIMMMSADYLNPPNRIQVPILIEDGQIGSIEVLVTLNYEGELSFSSKTISVKPLLSFRPVDPPITQEAAKENNDYRTFDITGEAKSEWFRSWLAECFQDISADRSLQSFQSLATSNIITIYLGDNKLRVISNEPKAQDIIRRTILRKATDMSLKLRESSPDDTTSRYLQ